MSRDPPCGISIRNLRLLQSGMSMRSQERQRDKMKGTFMKLIKSTMLVLAVMIAFAPAITVQAGDISKGDRVIRGREQDVALERGRELAFLLAPIQTAEDLDRYLAELQQNPEARSPLNLLSPAARERFLNSLVFTDRGLGGYHYGDLQAQLTASQIYRLLSLFGAQHTTPLLKGARIESRADQLIMEHEVAPDNAPADYKDMECVSRATCGPHLTYICMSSC
ncbi:MAG TPA: hypothetical protein VF432_09455 [Thermoanaerobaculia bacterium]